MADDDYQADEAKQLAQLAAVLPAEFKAKLTALSEKQKDALYTVIAASQSQGGIVAVPEILKNCENSALGEAQKKALEESYIPQVTKLLDKAKQQALDLKIDSSLITEVIKIEKATGADSINIPANRNKFLQDCSKGIF